MANSGSLWTTDEDEQLKNLYTKYNMDILEIAKIHKRSTEAIRLRLVKNGLIKDDNFIKTELVDLEKNKIASGIRENGISLLSEILSKHFTEINEKIDNLELKLNILIDKNELSGLD
jgi:hypothetical protein